MIRAAAAAALVCGAMLRPALAAEVDTAGATTCETVGYLVDKDPKGTNVRAAPRANAPVIGRLPPIVYISPTDPVGTGLHIVGAKDGWLLIRDAKGGPEDRVVFEGPGWISAALVSVTLGGHYLRAEPKDDGKAVADLIDSDKGYGPDSYHVQRIHNCAGKFLEVTASPTRGVTVHGWTRHVCTAQLTTCDSSEP